LDRISRHNVSRIAPAFLRERPALRPALRRVVGTELHPADDVLLVRLPDRRVDLGLGGEAVTVAFVLVGASR
jgi:hypothetical protein